MRCPFCNFDDSKVIDTAHDTTRRRPAADGSVRAATSASAHTESADPFHPAHHQTGRQP